MPYSVKKVGDKYRLFERDHIAKTKNGNPVDGGGSSNKQDVIKQMQAINISKHKASNLTDEDRSLLLGVSLDYFYSLVGTGLNDFNENELLNYSFALKIDEKENQFRVRVKDPSSFQQDTFKTKEIKPGLSIIVGRPVGSSKTQVQSFRFDKDKFSKKEVLKFIKDNAQKF
jgi:hypothetical protein